ncbi:MAG TPA: radical SAM protein [Candidatus Omnitrophota bacterium]|nr:radical SAM protein [Candidatus Omnitrophota bacterium]
MSIQENPNQVYSCLCAEASREAQGASPVSGHRYKHFHLYLIKPSKYDDDGYVIRYWKGVLPSNTLSCLNGLSEDVRERGILGKDLQWKTELIDDTVQKIPYQRIIRDSRCTDTKTVVCLVGVQTNQFVRASDLALKFRKAGVTVMIGGFHISGIMSTLPDLSPELVILRNAGVTLVAGEGEGGHWEKILIDAFHGKLLPVYNFLNDLPDLSRAAFPKINPQLQNNYALKHFGTLDCGRGCPFGCSFCTVINVQGRRMRFRDVDSLIQKIRDDYRQHDVSHYFFTDDNFCRNKNWEIILDRIIELREKEKIPFHFMMQLDTQSHLVPNFLEKSAKAGCRQVFIGMESLNQENLKAAKKNQNDIANFKALVDAFHDVGIVCHLAYIIGFPLDTKESVKKDIEMLMSLGAEQTSFFMMTPLPGSMDYKQAVAKGQIMDADLNNYDTFHETHRHARMKPGEWQEAYEAAWKSFYSIENMKNILRQPMPFENYWGVITNFIWYKNSIEVEGGHPMIHGFVRLKGRLERRPDYPVENRWQYCKRRFYDILGEIKGWWKLTLEIEEVWLATRRRGPLEARVVAELARLTQSAREWRDLRCSEIHHLYQKAAIALEKKGLYRLRIPSRFQIWLHKWNFITDPLSATRKPFERFWRKVYIAFRRREFLRINYFRIFWVGFEEFILFCRFFISIVITGLFIHKH